MQEIFNIQCARHRFLFKSGRIQFINVQTMQTTGYGGLNRVRVELLSPDLHCYVFTLLYFSKKCGLLGGRGCVGVLDVVNAIIIFSRRVVPLLGVRFNRQNTTHRHPPSPSQVWTTSSVTAASAWGAPPTRG